MKTKSSSSIDNEWVFLPVFLVLVLLNLAVYVQQYAVNGVQQFRMYAGLSYDEMDKRLNQDASISTLSHTLIGHKVIIYQVSEKNNYRVSGDIVRYYFYPQRVITISKQKFTQLKLDTDVVTMAVADENLTTTRPHLERINSPRDPMYIYLVK